MKRKDIIIFWIHLVTILAFLSTPFYLSWKLIWLLGLLYYLELLVFGNCILSIIQFDSKRRSESFYSFTLEHLGFEVNRKKVVFIVDHLIPWMVLGFSLLWQVILGK